MTTISIATLNTRNFQFEAFGETADTARKALEAGLLKHAAQYSDRLAADWWKTFEGDIQIREVTLGASFRDGERMTQL